MDKSGEREEAEESVDIREGALCRVSSGTGSFYPRLVRRRSIFHRGNHSPIRDRLTRKLSIDGYIMRPNVYLFESNDIMTRNGHFSRPCYNIADYYLPVDLPFTRWWNWSEIISFTKMKRAEEYLKR